MDEPKRDKPESDPQILPTEKFGETDILPDIKAAFDTTLKKAKEIGSKYAGPSPAKEPEA